MEGILLLIVLISFAISASSSKKKKAARTGVKAAHPTTKAAHPAVQRTPRNAGIPKVSSETADKQQAFGDVLPYEEFEHDGSIEMPAMEAHEHEGKPMACPAEERAKPRPRPSKLAPQKPQPKRAGLQLSFNANSVVQAAVMAEVLKRPEFRNGRRVIR